MRIGRTVSKFNDFIYTKDNKMYEFKAERYLYSLIVSTTTARV